MTECTCNYKEMRAACQKFDECLALGKLKTLNEKVYLTYDPEIGAYRIPQIVDRSSFVVTAAYCEIRRIND